MLLGMPCLVLGFGRIGKLLSHRLRGMGAEVTATARRPEDLSWIRAYGFRDLETERLEGKLGQFRLVFNTVPAPVLTGELLAELPEGCLCVDLASAPGIDSVSAAERGVSLVWARSLPGRYVPAAAARAIWDTVRYMILEERSDPV
jgi:dipicolinate synthase subunit A